MACNRKRKASEMAEPSQTAQPSTSIRKRGASLLKNYTKKLGEGNRVEVTLNAQQQPIGKNRAKLVTYIGSTVKSTVPITIDEWKSVSEEDLEHIWDIVTAKSEKFRQMSMMNDCPYRGSKKGYVGIAEDYKAANNMDPSSILSRAILYKEGRKGKDGKCRGKAIEVVEKIDDYIQKESSGEFISIGRKDVLAMALGKEEHPGRVRGVGQNLTITDYFGHAFRRASSSFGVNVTEAALLEASNMIKATMKAEVESWLNEERQATRKFIQALVDERKQYLPDKPLPEMPSFYNSIPNDQVHPSAKASCSREGELTTSNVEGTRDCTLCWPNLDQVVAKGVVYQSSSQEVMLHFRGVEKDQVRVSVDAPMEGKGGLTLPFPTDEVCTVLDAVGHFIAWPEHLVQPCVALSKDSPLKEKDKGVTNTKQSGTGPVDAHAVSSIMEDYQWMLEEFDDGSYKVIEISQDLFTYNHHGISIGKEQIQILLEKKEIDVCHVSLYMRCLFETYCKDVVDMFGFLCPTKISPSGDSGTIKDRATYIANAMTDSIENRIFLAPYKSGNHWVLLVLHPHFGTVYWIDPLRSLQEKDAEELIDLSYTLKYTSLGKKRLRKQPLWQVVKCPHQSNLIESGYYMLRCMWEIIWRRSIIIPKIWYGNKGTFSDDEIDDTRKELMEHLVSHVIS